MKNPGYYLLMLGVWLAVCFDSVAVTTLGCFIAGMGLGFIARENE